MKIGVHLVKKNISPIYGGQKHDDLEYNVKEAALIKINNLANHARGKNLFVFVDSYFMAVIKEIEE